MDRKRYANVEMIVFDGGPNGGKSSGMSRVTEYLISNGYAVVSTPEAATEIMTLGIMPDSFGSKKIFQRLITRRILDNEQLLCYAASQLAIKMPKKKGYVLCDRGLMSLKAYASSPMMFKRLLLENGVLEADVHHARYAQVVHLRSTACGLETIYNETRKNNPVRTETAQQARALDNRILKIWSGHPDLTIVDNSCASFEEKMQTVIGAIARRIGLPTPLAIERKFLIDPKDLRMPSTAVKVRIRQYYVQDDLYIREMISSAGVRQFFRTQKSCTAHAQRFRCEEIISQKEFGRIRKDLANKPIPYVEKERYFFVNDGQYYRIDQFLSTPEPLVILEVQPTTDLACERIPKDVHVIKEVTQELAYYNYYIARRTIKRSR